MTRIGKSMKSRLSWIKFSLYTVLFLTLFVVAAVPLKIGVLRPNHAESAAIAKLRSIANAQEEFQALGAKDADGDGTGEYGNFIELAGGNSSVNLKVPLLSSTYTYVDENGRYKSTGYYFRILVGNEPVPGTPGSGRDEPACISECKDGAEKYWICYAWPVCKAKGRSRAFYCTQDGIVMQSSNYKLTGSNAVPVTGSWTPVK